MGNRKAKPAPVAVIRILLLAPVALAATALSGCGQGTDDVLEGGKKAFEQFRFHDAKAAFAAALAEDPNNAEAAYAYARTVLVLNEYEEAISSFERALALDPNDHRSHEGYLLSLVWGGTLRGRRAWLDRALESGGDTIRKFPDLAPAYDLMERASRELNEPGLWLRILASLEPHIGDSPVFRVHHLGAKLSYASSNGDEETVTGVEQELRAQLQTTAGIELASDTAAQTASDPDTAARRYQLAYGYKLLGDKDEERAWLRRLEELAVGKHLAATLSHFDVHYRGYIAARDQPADVRLDLIDRWQRNFPARWDNEDFTTRSVPMKMRLEVLKEEARRRAEADAEMSDLATSPGGLASISDDELIDQIVALTEQLGRLDTWGGASVYVITARELLALEQRPEEALRLADIALARLEEGQSGMLYPGTAPEQLESATANTIAALEHVRGQALHRLGRVDNAEAALGPAQK